MRSLILGIAALAIAGSSMAFEYKKANNVILIKADASKKVDMRD